MTNWCTCILHAILITMDYYLGVDIGGTQIRAALFLPGSSTPDKVARTLTKGDNTPLERLVSVIHTIWPKNGNIIALGIATPGPVDPYRGVVISAPNIPGWNNLSLRDILQENFAVPVIIGNDANFAALGEWKYGAGRGHNNMIYLTISTGIGGGVIIDNHLLLGDRGLAAEMGHITILPDGPTCACGQKGHLEAISSGTAISKWVTDELMKGISSCLTLDQPITSKDIALAASQGDSLAIQAFNRAGYYLGMAIANFLHIFNSTAVIIGGGVAQSGPLLLKPVKEALKQFVIDREYITNLVLANASLGDEAGLIGALTIMETQFPDLKMQSSEIVA
jgi:glucokinase